MDDWTPFPQSPTYLVSSQGQVKNEKTGRILKPKVLKTGHLQFHLKGKYYYLARMVAEAFHGPPPYPKCRVRYRDEDVKNCKADNLEWGGTKHSQEVIDAFKADLSGDMTQTEAARKHGLSGGWVSTLARGGGRGGEGADSHYVKQMEVWDGTSDPRKEAEVWTPVPCFEVYMVSNKGRVARARRLLKPSAKNVGGYPSVRLTKPSGESFSVSLHRVVLTAFDGPAPVYPDALGNPVGMDGCHEHGDKVDATLAHLMWGTRQENIEHNRINGVLPTGESHGRSVLSVSVLQGHLQEVASGKFKSRAEAHDAFLRAQGVPYSRRNYNSILVGRLWKHVERPDGLETSWEALPRSGGPRVSQAAYNTLFSSLEADVPLTVMAGQSGLSPTHLSYYKKRLASAGTGEDLNCLEPVARLSQLTEGIKRGSIRLGDTQVFLAEEEILSLRRAGGSDFLAGVILPLCCALVRAHAASWGWFFPAQEPLAPVLSKLGAVQPAGPQLSPHLAGSRWLKAQFISFWSAGQGPAIGVFQEKKLQRVLCYRLGLNAAEETFSLSLKQVRRGFVVGRQAVSFFKPAVAAAIYKRWLTRPDPVVWDPSCGFGGRMLGFAGAFPEGTYVGCEPAQMTFSDLERVAQALPCTTQLHRTGSEVFSPAPGSFDLVFTSPPYFDKERYFDESGQCWKEFPTAQAWGEGFVRPTLQRAATGLKGGGHLVLNVEEALLPLFRQEAEAVGLGEQEVHRLPLRSDHFRRAAGKTEKRFEPVVVWKKLPDAL